MCSVENVNVLMEVSSKKILPCDDHILYKTMLKQHQENVI